MKIKSGRARGGRSLPLSKLPPSSQPRYPKAPKVPGWAAPFLASPDSPASGVSRFPPESVLPT